MPKKINIYLKKGFFLNQNVFNLHLSNHNDMKIYVLNVIMD
jgi:hypothetical protein